MTDEKSPDSAPVRDMFVSTFRFTDEDSDGRLFTFPYVEFHMDTAADAERLSKILLASVLPPQAAVNMEAVGSILIHVDETNSWSDEFVFRAGEYGPISVHSLYTQEEVEALGLTLHDDEDMAKAAHEATEVVKH